MFCWFAIIAPARGKSNHRHSFPLLAYRKEFSFKPSVILWFPCDKCWFYFFCCCPIHCFTFTLKCILCEHSFGINWNWQRVFDLHSHAIVLLVLEKAAVALHFFLFVCLIVPQLLLRMNFYFLSIFIIRAYIHISYEWVLSTVWIWVYSLVSYFCRL